MPERAADVPGSRDREPPGSSPKSRRRFGWLPIVFVAGVLLAALGVWNVVDGLTALIRGDFIVTDADRVIALEVAGWGWILLAIGVVEITAGIALWIGAYWARVVAVLVAGLNGVVQFAFVAAYPFGAILIMIVAALVIYAVVRHGSEARV
jgi:hypothetical protein